MFVISSYVQLPLRPFTCWYHGVYESTQPLNLTQARLDALRLALVASATGSWMVLLAFQLQAKFGSEVFSWKVDFKKSASASKILKI